MSKNSGEGRSAGSDDPIFLLVIVGGVCAVGLAIWYFAHTYIATFYAYLRYLEFFLLHLIGELVDIPIISNVHSWINGLCGPDGIAGMCTRDLSTVTWSEIADSSFFVNILLLVGLITYCIRLGMLADRTHPKIKFVKSHTIKSFVDEQKKVINPKSGKPLYPHLGMFSELDLIAEPLDHPIFGMSETSKQFVFKNRLVADWKDEGGGFWAPTLDREKTALVLRKQLGLHWTSSANLSPGETLLVAIAMPRVAATDSTLDDAAFKSAMRDSENMIHFCWEQFKCPEDAEDDDNEEEGEDGDKYAWLWPKIDLTSPREIIKRFIGRAPVQAIIERHGFNRTVIIALFMQARRLGVLPPAEMRWLRFYDRPLWYLLENVGRQAGFAEAAGVLSHYLYEAKAGVSLVEPQLDKAVTGVNVAINNFKFTAADKAKYEAEAPKPKPMGLKVTETDA